MPSKIRSPRRRVPQRAKHPGLLPVLFGAWAVIHALVDSMSMMPSGTTTNLGLTKPSALTGGNAGVLNENWDLIDAAVGGLTPLDVSAGVPMFLVTHPSFSGGADPTGAAESSGAIQAALDAAKAAGAGIALAPKGTFLVTTQLDIDDASGVVLAGLGWGTKILWDGGNTTPVVKLAGAAACGIRDLWIMGSPGTAGKKATAAIELNSVSGHVNYLNRIENVQIGPSPADTQSTTFAKGIYFSGDVNNDGNTVRSARITYCDTGIDVSGTQMIDNVLDQIRTIGNGTDFDLNAHTTVGTVELSGATVTNFDVANAALVTCQKVTSENSNRLLTIAGQSHFTIRSGYWMASSSITAGGDFISGTDNTTDQAVTLEDWQLTYSGGYAGPTPVISLKCQALGSAAKVLTLNRVRGIVTAFTESNLDVAPVTNNDYRLVQGSVWDGTAYRSFRNVLTATGQAPDFTLFYTGTRFASIAAEMSDNGSGSDQTVIQITAPAATLKVGTVIQFEAYTLLDNTAGGPASPTVTFKLKRGSTSAITGVTASIAAGVTGRAGFFRGEIIVRTVGAAGTCMGSFFYIDAGGNTRAVSTSTISIDTTAAVTFSLTETWSTADNHLTFKAENASVRIMDPVP